MIYMQYGRGVESVCLNLYCLDEINKHARDFDLFPLLQQPLANSLFHAYIRLHQSAALHSHSYNAKRNVIVLCALNTVQSFAAQLRRRDSN